MIVQRFRGELVPMASPSGELQLGIELAVTFGGAGGETLHTVLRPEGDEAFVTAKQVAAWLEDVGRRIAAKSKAAESPIVVPTGMRN